MSEKLEELKEIILEYISEYVDPTDTETIKKFDELIRQLELKNI